MKVTLIRATPDIENTIYLAAKTSSYSDSLETLKTAKDPSVLLRKLVGAGHLSPFEHVGFTFAIQGLSRVASHQLVRHRLASYTQQSQRSADAEYGDLVVPPTIKSNPELLEVYIETYQRIQIAYKHLVDSGIPSEDARYLLPGGFFTQLIMTMNARELIYASSIRLCNKAQWEIRELFANLKREVSLRSEVIGEAMIPKCQSFGYCNEIKGCGKYPSQKQLLGNVFVE